jgi:acetyl-CoA carboxylase/biotin carboxylase 1
MMEMYADEDSRGGILEPEGIVGIKYKKDRQLETMARLDPVYGDLKKKSMEKGLSAQQANEIKAKMTEREDLLLPVYLQIALQYSDLHDRAGRMKAKGVIRLPLEWAQARRFFYWRLRRRLNEEYVLKRMATAQSKELVSRGTNLMTLEAWSGVPKFATDDMSVAMWYEENRKTIHDKIEGLKTEAVAFDVASLLRSNKSGGLKGVAQVLSMLPVEEKEEVLKWLQKQ